MERLPNPLTVQDVHSSTWVALRDYMRDRITQLREENDSGDSEITAKRRGRIAELKDMLTLGEEAQHGGPDR